MRPCEKASETLVGREIMAPVFEIAAGARE
jgi:hypothetical protein